MILTKHVFCVYSALHLLPKREVTQLICLTTYVGTTQLKFDKKRSDQCRLIVHKTAAVQHNMKCYSGHLMNIPTFFNITKYIAGLKNIVQPYYG